MKTRVFGLFAGNGLILVDLTKIKVCAGCCEITLFEAFLHCIEVLVFSNSSSFSLKWKLFLVFSQKFQCLHLFRIANGFKPFEANLVVLTEIWSTTTFLLFARNLHSFHLFRTENSFCVYLLLLCSVYLPWTKTAFLAFFGPIEWF